MNATASELDFTLTRYEGWRTFAETPPRRQPPRKSVKELANLGRREAALYADERAVWHANLGPFITPQMHHVMDEITELLESNRQDTYQAKTSAVIDAYPGLGKTTLAMHIGRQFHRHQIDLFGEQTSDGDQRIPVAYIPLAGRTTIRTMNIMLCDFYGLPTAGNSRSRTARRERSLPKPNSPHRRRRHPLPEHANVRRTRSQQPLEMAVLRVSRHVPVRRC